MTLPSGKKVIKAGTTLCSNWSELAEDEINEAIDILSYWRSSHEEPLENALSFLKEKCEKIDSDAIYAKRLKRLPSILYKLTRFEGKVNLKNMQDLGGCRVIVSCPKKLKKTVQTLRKNSLFQNEFGKMIRADDYVNHPKEDGYRSYHLVGSFYNYNQVFSRKIEIQIRTLLQHYWATTLEIVDLFTGNALKTTSGNSDWHKFFLLVSKQLHSMERLVKTEKFDPTNTKHFDLYSTNIKNNISLAKDTLEIDSLARKLNVQELLAAYTHSVKITENAIDVSNQDSLEGFFLIILDTEKKQLEHIFFPKDESSTATMHYTEKEKEFADKKNITIALIHADKVDLLKEAYPNYFADSFEFLNHLTLIIATGRELNRIVNKSNHQLFRGLLIQ